MTTPEISATPLASAASVHAHALKQAFLRGAALSPDAITAELSPEMMELLGKMMASCLQGSIDLLSLRSLVKQEVHADVTTVLVRNNNPLKFFPDSQTVLTQMLRKKMPGFMEPIEALDDAFADLRGHQLGVVAGARAGMQATLASLDPERIDAALPPPSTVEKLFPSARAVRQRDAVRKRYREVLQASDAQLFGAPFLDAYETAVEKVRADADAAHAAQVAQITQGKRP